MNGRSTMRVTHMKFITAFIAWAAVLLASGAHASVAKDTVRADVGGIDVVALPTSVQDVVTVVGSLPAGDDRSPPGNVMLATLTGAMLDKGTTAQDKFAIAQKLGNVGAALSFSVDTNTLMISGRCLRKDLPLLVGLMAEQLRNPAFSEQEFAKLKVQLQGAVRQQQEDTGFRAGDAFSRAIYPVGHPNRQPTAERMLADMGGTTIAAVKAFHQQYYGPTGMRLVIVGDVDPASAQAEVRKAFSGWTGGSLPPAMAPAKAAASAQIETIVMADKTSVAVVIGQATQLRYSDPDTLPLRLGTRIFGGEGFTTRLMANVRDKEGLTYGVYAYVSGDTFADGDWRIQGDFAPALLDKGIASTRRQLDAWHADGVTDAELQRAKSEFAGTYQVGLATSGGMAGTILVMLNRGMPLAFIDEYPARVNATTREEVNGAIRKHLDPAKMTLVKAGTVGTAGAPAAK
jgi:zinc protease